MCQCMCQCICMCMWAQQSGLTCAASLASIVEDPEPLAAWARAPPCDEGSPAATILGGGCHMCWVALADSFPRADRRRSSADRRSAARAPGDRMELVEPCDSGKVREATSNGEPLIRCTCERRAGARVNGEPLIRCTWHALDTRMSIARDHRVRRCVHNHAL